MTTKAQAKNHNEAGLTFYHDWKMEKAISAFSDAVAADGTNPDYCLNLVRAYARNGDFDQAMEALGPYLQVEPEEAIATRYEQLFSTGLDQVETILIERMGDMKMSMQQVGKAIQMWLEYRITIGRRPFRIPKPELWAAALLYAIVKINFADAKRKDVATLFNIKEQSLTSKYNDLIETLDIMPADYRYFVGEKNPLDKLVEAAQLLEKLEQKFREE